MNSPLRPLILMAGFTLAAFGQSPRTQPYSADEVTETVQTLADGTHITHSWTDKIYSDSERRTRTERTAPEAGSPMIISIFDPVAHVRYTVNMQKKVAYKQDIPTPANRPTLRRAPAQQPETPESTTEKLGTQAMEGLEVEGTRTTTVWPVGSVGNDQPITEVRELWWSRALNAAILDKTSDPRRGETTRKLTNIVRAEPDPSRFQPPPDFQIVEEGQPR